MKERLKTGDRLSSLSYGTFTIEEYVNANVVVIKFDATGYVTKASAGNIRNGRVRDNTAKTVYGVGCFGDGEFRARHPNNGPCTKEYGTWNSMIFRCYGEGRDESTYRNYHDCFVCDEWLNFQNFAAWCQTQPEMLCKDSSLDKDIRVKGNKIYSPSTCCFVPQYINSAVTGIKHQNSSGRAGVWKFKDSYVSEITMFGAKSQLGSFDNLEDAYKIQKVVKEAYISGLADIFRKSLNEEVYMKLKEWTCE